ncbi:sensor histidine kinase [Penaeicola halotolerans]|uniref:sensor histidine kinase n=1 Tax=Penaeicola halotolerans TaxID=2793196 RepID=UPI001CF8F760|nr:ATP-binding protein [Penaeicola halotolerans]
MKRFIYIFLSAIALFITGYFWFYDSSDELQQKELFRKTVQSNIDQLFEELTQDSTLIANRINARDTVTFTYLNIPTNHAFFVYRDDKLLYWSDNEYIPQNVETRDSDLIRLVENTSGKFISKTSLIEISSGDQYRIVQLIPLYRNIQLVNQYINGGYDPSVFGNDNLVISSVENEFFEQITDPNGEFLFAVSFRSGYALNKSGINSAALIFSVSLFALLTIFSINFITPFWRKNRKFLALVYTTAILILIRVLMISLKIPFGFFDLDLFDPKFYAASIINPSLGDLLLNILALGVIVTLGFSIIAENYFLKKFRKFTLRHPIGFWYIIAYAVSLGFGIFYYLLYRSLLFNSQWSLDISSIADFDVFKLISYLIIFMGGAFYILMLLLGINMVVFARNRLKHEPYTVLVIFAVIALAFDYATGLEMRTLIIFHVLALLFVITLRLYQNIFSFSFSTFLTLFFGAMICAMIGVFALYKHQELAAINDKQKFSNQLLIDNDILGEFLLAEVMDNIRSDVFIRSKLAEPFGNKEVIERKIKRVYLGSYFDKYDAFVYIFNSRGDLYNRRSGADNLRNLMRKFVKFENQTAVTNLYFSRDQDQNFNKNYFGIVDINRNNVQIGTVAIELRQRRLLASSVFPKLLIDNRYVNSDPNQDFDYAIYENKRLMLSVGNINYRTVVTPEFFESRRLREVGIRKGGYHHMAFDTGEDEMVIVSSPLYEPRLFIADFSLILLIFILMTIVVVVLFESLKGFRHYTLNYSTKIQLYLNLAFFLPMLIVSAVTVTLVSRSYTQDLTRQYFDKAQLIKENISRSLETYFSGEMDIEELEGQLYALSGTTNSDINVYDQEGRLLSGNQPAIYEKKILSDLINPIAFSQIKEQYNTRIIIDEQIGKLDFKTVYMALRSPNGDKLNAIIGIPFFESASELNRLRTDVLGNIINIFIIILIIFLVVSYFASQNLTSPFKLIAQKIKSTSLEKNEPMFWPNKDEIGLLVGEYNKMLEKLEASRESMAASEKETAWREMAKQVAHEIKNPLTPMKLTLQHMRRLQMEGKLDDPKQLERPVNTLLEQIDTLSDIATSFSDFAKMPLPKNEKIDLAKVLRQIETLFRNHEKGSVICQGIKGEIYVLGDEKLFGRVFSNLVINGIQAVPDDQVAEIKITARQSEGKVKITVKDNGQGIPSHLREKVFVPNFSTKTEGSGLGLAIVKRGVENAGGKIWFDSKEGAGTTFYLEFLLV